MLQSDKAVQKVGIVSRYGACTNYVKIFFFLEEAWLVGVSVFFFHTRHTTFINLSVNSLMKGKIRNL